MELALWFILVIVIGAFICEYVDSTLGMGYDTDTCTFAFWFFADADCADSSFI